MSESPTTEVDARGSLCPQPIIDLARAARGAADGTVLRLLADDPAAEADVPAWCRMRGHAFRSRVDLPPEEGGGVAYTLELK